MCFFDCKCKSLKRLGENIKTNNKKTKRTTQLKEKHKQTEIQDFQPSTRPRKINISQGLAGRFLLFFFFMYFMCLFMFSLEFVFMFFFVFLYVCFDCKCKSLKRLGENIKQKHKETNKHKNSKKNIKQTENKQKYSISSPRTSAKNKYL